MSYKIIDKPLTGDALTGKKLKKVKAVVVHWFADPMAKAANVIKWWQGQGNGIAAHDVIDLNGDLYHAIDYGMMAYHVGCKRGYTKEALARLSKAPNDCTVGIECAHLDNRGKMTPETYATLVQHTAKLVKQFGLTVDDIWLHSEIVGKDYKDCHRWFTTTMPSDWIKFKKEVGHILTPPAAPMLNGFPIKQGQIGLLEITAPINLWFKADNDTLEFARILNTGEYYRVYGYSEDHGGQYNVGNAYVTKMDGYVNYISLSDNQLQAAKEYYETK